MVPIPKIIGTLSCGFLLCLGLSNAAQASPSDDMIHGHTDVKNLSTRATTGHAVQGTVLRVEGYTVVVKERDGKEARVVIDPTTASVTGQPIEPGNFVEARVNENNHAMTIFSTR